MTSSDHTTHTQKIWTLTPTIQNYHWGKKGHTSRIARYIPSPDDNEHYAELWYGSHASAPSYVRAVLPSENASLAITSVLPSPLSFLFKVLSIEEPLSLQAHPTKALAQILHEKDPHHYPDTNHKPEIAIALSVLRLVYGFKSLQDLRKTAKEYPPFITLFPPAIRALLEGSPYNGDESLCIKECYHALLTVSDDTLTEACIALRTLITKKSAPSWIDETLLFAINRYGTSDIGIPTFLMMNALTVPPLHGIYISPNVLHAYISGDIVECMAASDNVVRGGLTPKYKDLSTLRDMLEFTPGLPEIITPQHAPDGTSFYSTPTSEFTLSKFEEGKFTLSSHSNAHTITLCALMEGTANYTCDSITGTLSPGGSILIMHQERSSSTILQVSRGGLGFIVRGSLY